MLVFQPRTGWSFCSSRRGLLVQENFPSKNDLFLMSLECRTRPSARQEAAYTSGGLYTKTHCVLTSTGPCFSFVAFVGQIRSDNRPPPHTHATTSRHGAHHNREHGIAHARSLGTTNATYDLRCRPRFRRRSPRRTRHPTQCPTVHVNVNVDHTQTGNE